MEDGTYKVANKSEVEEVVGWFFQDNFWQDEGGISQLAYGAMYKTRSKPNGSCKEKKKEEKEEAIATAATNNKTWLGAKKS